MAFTFKQFHVDDDQCAMKVGTDSILLGTMTQVSQSDRILDIGCGCGLLSLMLAQRIQGNGEICAVEVDEAAATQARHNIAQSPWPDIIKVVQTDINQFTATQPFDLIISNPPYFVDSLLGPKDARNVARHTGGLTQLQLLKSVVRLLSAQGMFWLILPTKEAQQLIGLSTTVGLHLQQLCAVHTVKQKPIHRYIMAFARSDCLQVAKSAIDVYDEKSQYTSQFIALTRNFYLNRG
ncbi:MAG: methyltransferase [Algicola sp.]|nr:methyltransferase [Algicola sp.]